MEKSEGGVVVAADTVAGGSFSQLLFSEEADDNQEDQVMGSLDHHHHHHHHSTSDGGFNFTSAFYSTEKPPKMLCFGDYGDDLAFNNDISKTTPKSGGGVVTCTTDSSSASSTSNNNNNAGNSLPKSNRKRNGCNENRPVVRSLSTGTGTGAPARSQRNCKKARTSENSTMGGHAKVKKERLGERIAALQLLVSPFGKTDTASVLHEALGYIKFLQAQVQVLCSPYLQGLPSNSSKPPPLPGCEENNGEGELKRKDLRSRGLCLVPVECTLHVAESNGADFWSPATIKNGSSDH